VRLDPGSALYHENLGRAYRKKSQWKEADRELEATSKVAPSDTAVWVALASTRAAEKRLDDAAAAYATALEIDPLDEEAAAGLGATLRAQGKLADADAALTKSLSSIAKSPVLWNNLGVVRVERGQYAQAVDAFQKALAIDGAFEAAKANLARAQELAALDRAAS
jgi:Tfp pilus assembly protein PilF